MASNLPPVPPPATGDLSGPMKRNLVSAGVLVLAGGVAFGLLGMVRGDTVDGVEVVAQPSASQAPSATGSDPDDTATAEATSGESASTDTDAPAQGDEPATDDPATEPAADPTEAATAPAASPTPTPTPSPEATPEATQDDGRIAPSSISIQILDAVLTDDDAAVDEWRAKLKDDGYRVVAKNDAIREYATTTVMYTAGFQAEAEQIAKDYGFSEVQPKPDNLSDSVQIHLVIGADAR